jgi:hypothetical protein
LVDDCIDRVRNSFLAVLEERLRGDFVDIVKFLYSIDEQIALKDVLFLEHLSPSSDRIAIHQRVAGFNFEPIRNLVIVSFLAGELVLVQKLANDEDEFGADLQKNEHFVFIAFLLERRFVLFEPLAIVVELQADIEQQHLDYYLDHDLHAFVVWQNLSVALALVEGHEVDFVGEEVVVDGESFV